MRIILAAVAMLVCVSGVTSKTVDDKLEPYQRISLPGMKRYEFYSAAQNWTNAHQVCTSSGGHLAMPTSDEEAAVMLDLMAANGVNQIHLGFNDIIEEGSYATVRGLPLSKLGYKNWALEKQPTADPNYKCGSLIRFTTSGLAITSCTSNLQHICEFKLWDDYDLISGLGYYKFHKTYVSWDEARRSCRAEGADLLIFNSKEERDAVLYNYVVPILGVYALWYGAHHMYANHNFVTLSDEPLEQTGFSSWAPDEPGNYGNWEYPVLAFELANMSKGTLSTESKSVSYPYICKHGLHELD